MKMSTGSWRFLKITTTTRRQPPLLSFAPYSTFPQQQWRVTRTLLLLLASLGNSSRSSSRRPLLDPDSSESKEESRTSPPIRARIFKEAGLYTPGNVTFSFEFDYFLLFSFFFFFSKLGDGRVRKSSAKLWPTGEASCTRDVMLHKEERRRVNFHDVCRMEFATPV